MSATRILPQDETIIACATGTDWTVLLIMKDDPRADRSHRVVDILRVDGTEMVDEHEFIMATAARSKWHAIVEAHIARRRDNIASITTGADARRAVERAFAA